jgi:sugar O-acyltransferase (sialic acid O-acetyltransferase NeuD family)
MKKPIVLVGAGGHAMACIDVIERMESFKIVGLIGLDVEIGKRVLGYEIIGSDEMLPTLRLKINHAFVAVGQITSAITRKDIFTKLINLNFELPVLVSPEAFVSSHSQIGNGTIIHHGARIGPGSQIGMNCIINTNAVVEHGAKVGDYCHVSTGALINGDAIIGSETFIGSGAVIRNNTSVGSQSIVGMGSHIFQNLPEKSRASVRQDR